MVAALRQQSQDDVVAKLEGAVPIVDDDKEKSEQIGTLVASVKWQMGNDRKAAPLKTLQGLIWKKGYKDATIKGQYVERTK